MDSTSGGGPRPPPRRLQWPSEPASRWLNVIRSIGRGRGPFGQSLASGGTPGGPVFNAPTISAGVTLSLADSFRAAISGDNLTNPGTALAPTLARAGVGYTTSSLSLEADGLLDFTTCGEHQGAR